MTHDQDEIQKIYVNPDGAAVIRCPDCEAVKTFGVEKFRGSKHLLKVKCGCRHLFQVRLEFRKFYRKPTKLTGEYVLPDKIHRGRMMVVNLSKRGLCVQVLGAHRLIPGQEIQVSFTLDDKHCSLIDRQVAVRQVEKNYVGCEFMDNTSHDKVLGFYLMV